MTTGKFDTYWNAAALGSPAALLPWLGRFELAGEPTRLAQTHVMGYSTLPLRLRAA